ncbi:hypothetical protein GCM10022252_18570 [Streptosporangium oxazolinicum]|uniref:Uncharacterized protein n=1 Tax=Streptosporangium oxazolinicum TaxID=909287 RepID=A0ABP8AN66_9ACTN
MKRISCGLSVFITALLPVVGYLVGPVFVRVTVATGVTTRVDISGWRVAGTSPRRLRPVLAGVA